MGFRGGISKWMCTAACANSMETIPDLCMAPLLDVYAQKGLGLGLTYTPKYSPVASLNLLHPMYWWHPNI